MDQHNLPSERTGGPRGVIGKYALTAMLACFLAAAAHAQPDDTPINMSCEQAIIICGATAIHYEHEPMREAGCLWYQFTLTEPTLIQLQGPSQEGGATATFMAQLDMTECPCEEGSMQLQFQMELNAGTYYIAIHFEAEEEIDFTLQVQGGECPETDCSGCLPPFMPEEGTDYIVNAWVKKEDAPLGTIDYGADPGESPFVRIEAPEGTVVDTYLPSIAQPVIEGWQLIEGRFTMPAAPTFGIFLGVGEGNALFDDVRLFPADGSMKCYVYDPENLRFTAELDERHFATFYEYDNEGKLVRVKKETERGIMTIQESRQNASHVTP